MHQGKRFFFLSMAWVFIFNELRDPLSWFLNQSLNYFIVQSDMMLDQDPIV